MSPNEPPVIERLGACAFFLDIDGTLADIAIAPHAAFIDPTTLRTVQRLDAHLGGAIALVSGRQLTDIDRMMGTSHFSAAGSHGAEIRQARFDRSPLAVCPPHLERFEALIAARFLGAPGLLIERKPFSIAVHYRVNPSLNRPVNDFLDALIREAKGVKKLQGKRVAEIVPADVSKGTAIATFMAREPFAGRIPVFAGDDITDEHGFETVNTFNGISIRIGHGPSCARYRFDRAANFRGWLEGLVRTAGEAA